MGPALKCNFDPTPAEFMKLPTQGYTVPEVDAKTQARKEGSHFVEKSTTHRNFFSVGTFTAPLRKLKILFHFKANAPGGFCHLLWPCRV